MPEQSAPRWRPAILGGMGQSLEALDQSRTSDPHVRPSYAHHSKNLGELCALQRPPRWVSFNLLGKNYIAP